MAMTREQKNARRRALRRAADFDLIIRSQLSLARGYLRLVRRAIAEGEQDEALYMLSRAHGTRESARSLRRAANQLRARSVR